MGFRENAIKQAKDCIVKYEPDVKIVSISDIYETECEWCSNKTNMIFIGLSADSNGIHRQMTIFEDPSFHLQSEWRICGRCENS